MALVLSNYEHILTQEELKQNSSSIIMTNNSRTLSSEIEAKLEQLNQMNKGDSTKSIIGISASQRPSLQMGKKKMAKTC